MGDVEARLRELGERVAAEAVRHEPARRRIVRRARLRRGLTVAVPTAAAVLLAALVYPTLGSEDARVTGPIDLAAVARATEDAGSARVTYDIEMELEHTGAAGMHATGEVDFDDGRSYFRMEQEGVAGLEGEIEMITIDGVLYQRAVGHPKWSKNAAGDMGNALGESPEEMLATLVEASDEVTNLGVETRAGVEVTHLRAEVDWSALLDSPATGAEFDPVHVWVDAEGRAREIVSSGSWEAGTMRSSIAFSDFGVAVDVEAPAPEDVNDAAPGFEPELEGGESSGPGRPDEYVVGPDGFSEPHVVVESRGTGPARLCVNIPGDEPHPATVVDEAESEDLFTAVPSGAGATVGRSYSISCAVRLIPHAKVDLLLRDPARFTLHVGDGADEVVVELAEVRGPEVGRIVVPHDHEGGDAQSE